MRKIYTIVKWRYSSYNGWGRKEYGFNSILVSFSDRKDAVKYIKEEIGGVYCRGYYIKGDNLYTIKQTELR